MIVLCAGMKKINNELRRTQYELPRVSAQSAFHRRLSAFICVHLRLIFVSLIDIIREIKFGLFPIQEKIEPANNNQAHSCLNLLENKPQINADERRFVNLDIPRSSEVYPENDIIISPQSMQKAQSSAIPVTTYEKATVSRFRTRMTRIARIFTDPCASVSSVLSVFYCHTSAFICVYLRLIFVSLSDRAKKIKGDI